MCDLWYQLAKFLLFRLLEGNLLTPEESEKVRKARCKKYRPLSYQHSVVPLYSGALF